MNPRPRIIVNVAMTANSKIDSAARKGAIISSIQDKARVDCLRVSVGAVFVGGRALLNEDPKLTVISAEFRTDRLRKGCPENPARLGAVTDLSFEGTGGIPFGNGVRSKTGATYASLRGFFTSSPAQVYLFTTRCTEPEVLAHFETSGAMVRAMGQERVDLVAVFRSLHEAGIRPVLVEGGGTFIAKLFRFELVDDLTIYIAPIIFGGLSAPIVAGSLSLP